MGRTIPNVLLVPLALLALLLAGCAPARAGAGSAGGPASRIPAGVRVVVVTAVPGFNDKKTPPAPVTVTDPAKVAKLVALVNGLPLAARGTFSCPMDDHRGVRLSFLARTGGPAIASAFAKANGCAGVQLTVGSEQASLAGGTAPARQALTISGMRWHLSGYLPR